MPEYVELMKRCWDNDPEIRPTAKELHEILSKWFIKYPLETNEEKRIAVPENEPEIKYHPKSCYTSRKFDSAKFNEILAKDELLSNKVVIMDDDNYNDEIFISDNLDECLIKDDRM
ncbi:hypothetical protein RclHR1_04130005 [Rhizophagus clarus]|nr:hypothetical protein RclHR1_04130005 [Rhizophagus clarus]